MSHLKRVATVLLAVAILVWNRQPMSPWDEFMCDLVAGFFISYGIKSIWDDIEDAIGMGFKRWYRCCCHGIIGGCQSCRKDKK